MFFNGHKVSSLNDKVKKELEPCGWHTPTDLTNDLPSNYTGFIHDNKVHDNCRNEYLKSLYKWDQKYISKLNKFNLFKKNVNEAIKSLKNINNEISKKEHFKNQIQNFSETLQNGFKYIKKHGNKIKVRIDEVEIETIENKLKTLNQNLKSLSNIESKMEKRLYDIIKLTYKYDFVKVLKLNFAWNNYKDTIYLWNEYRDIYKNATAKIENYDKLYSNIMNELDEEELLTVKEQRNTRYKTKYYIDKDGNKINIDENINQLIIHK